MTHTLRTTLQSQWHSSSNKAIPTPASPSLVIILKLFQYLVSKLTVHKPKEANLIQTRMQAHVYTEVNTQLYTHVHTFISTPSIHTYTHMNINTYMHTFMHIHTQICTDIYTQTCIHRCTHIHKWSYTDMHIHACTHTHHFVNFPRIPWCDTYQVLFSPTFFILVCAH